ncbi:hypothetical protein EV44_g3300 [Erysiphe necator]|uniref:Uncharacterized protein n=1 Tax=Uncinula necator TaxID=52586 RepID=A0A0B1NW14_UNCNE|nr:hypothetical protein EV44_g3300 [Erysiphe necator]
MVDYIQFCSRRLVPLTIACSNTHTTEQRQWKCERNGKEFDRSLTKKVAVATLRIILSQVPSRGLNKNAELLKAPQPGDNSWATVPRKGQKKARENPSTIARVAPLGKTSHLISSHLISSHLISSHLISSHLISSHRFTSLHFTSLHFTSLHFTSLHLQRQI